MRIGLIGINKYAPYLNFACDLHIYAFQQYLKEHGHESVILDYKPVYHHNLDMRHPAKAAEKEYLQAVRKNKGAATLARLAELAVGYKSAPIERERRFDKFDAFVRQHLIFTPEEYDSDLLEVQDPQFDCYICVTDVIWQTMEKYTFDRGFFLASKAFDGKPKIAYAASRGASADLTPPQLDLFSSHLERFDSISVREQDFKEYIEANTDVTVRTTLDPVLLHDRSFWDDIAQPPSERGYVLLYYVMERSTDTITKAVEYAKFHGLTLIELSDRPLKFGRINDPDLRHIPRYDVGMEEWLGFIRGADAVFTNSFHAGCFSMLFEKLLFVGNRHGNKVPNFLKTFGLEACQIQAEDDVRTYVSHLSYYSAHAKLEDLRSESSDFILRALEAAEKKPPEDAAIEVAEAIERRHSITYPIRFLSGNCKGDAISLQKTELPVKVSRLKSGRLEYYLPSQRITNDGTAPVPWNHFVSDKAHFLGWTLRFRVDNRWFWYLSDGAIELSDIEGGTLNGSKAVLSEGEVIPHLPVTNISMVVLVAVWDKTQ